MTWWTRSRRSLTSAEVWLTCCPDWTGEQLAARSLCDEWSVHDVAAHLIMPLEVSMPKFMLTMLACRGNFDRANVRPTRQQASGAAEPSCWRSPVAAPGSTC